MGIDDLISFSVISIQSMNIPKRQKKTRHRLTATHWQHITHVHVTSSNGTYTPRPLCRHHWSPSSSDGHLPVKSGGLLLVFWRHGTIGFTSQSCYSLVGIFVPFKESVFWLQSRSEGKAFGTPCRDTCRLPALRRLNCPYYCRCCRQVTSRRLLISLSALPVLPTLPLAAATLPSIGQAQGAIADHTQHLVTLLPSFSVM